MGTACVSWWTWPSRRGNLSSRPERGAQIAGLPERPVGGDPPRHQSVQRALRVAAGEGVHHPPGDLAIGACPLGRVDVDAAEDRRFLLVQQRVVEGLVRGYFLLVPAQIETVLFEGHCVLGPGPSEAEDLPQTFARPHHGWAVGRR